MAKPGKPPPQLADTRQVTITITVRLFEMLEAMVETGYFGKTPQDAMVQLISEGVRAVHLQGEALFEGRDKFALLHGELIKRRAASAVPGVDAGRPG